MFKTFATAAIASLAHGIQLQLEAEQTGAPTCWLSLYNIDDKDNPDYEKVHQYGSQETKDGTKRINQMGGPEWMRLRPAIGY